MLCKGLELVVADEHVSKAATILNRAGLLPCSNPTPAAHLHVKESDLDVSIRRHSEILWFIPAVSDTGRLSPNYAIASYDSVLPTKRLGRGQGAFSQGGPPVIVPAAHILLESYIRQLSSREEYRSFYMGMIIHVWEYLDEDGLIDDSKLSPPCREFWRAQKSFEKPARELLGDLRVGLGDETRPFPGTG
ncbi:hypothetical protein GGR56DRAFT_650742 [Xylariaceae sp. FL0804]|nr:hypothetical protein GGR56DRAFT_650742 [Xylariaceae sp. FL0804]